MSFEASMEALEIIVKNLESGELPIDKSIAEFEKGIKLVKECQKLLDKAQGEVKTLMGDNKDDTED